MIFRLERCGMKFAHIGDLHIGKRVHDFSMLEDQRYPGNFRMREILWEMLFSVL